MSFDHTNVWIVRIVDEGPSDTRTWFVGPYGSTRADQTAARLEVSKPADVQRSCYVEALWSDDECLRVDDNPRRPLVRQRKDLP